jgi:hypothetical protein
MGFSLQCVCYCRQCLAKLPNLVLCYPVVSRYGSKTWIRIDLGICAVILEQSMGARNRIGIWLSYRPARLHRLAESNPWNKFLEKYRLWWVWCMTEGRTDPGFSWIWIISHLFSNTSKNNILLKITEINIVSIFVKCCCLCKKKCACLSNNKKSIFFRIVNCNSYS